MATVLDYIRPVGSSAVCGSRYSFRAIVGLYKFSMMIEPLIHADFDYVIGFLKICFLILTIFALILIHVINITSS